MPWTLPVIETMGRSVFDPIWAEREHSNPNAELLHVLRGRAVVHTPRYRIVGKAGDTIYTPCGLPHRDVFEAGSVFEVCLVHFTWAEEARVLGAYGPAELAAVRGPRRAGIADACHALYEEFCRGLPLGRELAGVRLLDILLRLCREAELRKKSTVVSPRSTVDQASPARGRRGQILEHAKRLMQENFSQPLSLEWLAERLNISPYYLSRVFSQDSGFRLSDYLTSLRMQHARGLLADGRPRVAQVAHAVGYRDPHYFAKVYRAHFGVSPSAGRGEPPQSPKRK